MARSVAEDPDVSSLRSLEEELTCGVCLSVFQCPVTIPCGHNFCQTCLLSSWRDSYYCPQCRAVFAARPELKKNTVLSTVVEAFSAGSGRGGAAAPGGEEEAEAAPGGEEEEAEAVLCDSCMRAEASRTCLTCMASYCEEHLRPHRDNPVFRLHRLGPPVADLMERICQEHHKLMELFCSQHGRSICSLCLHQEHKGCSVTTLEEQRSLKETSLREKLIFLDEKISKTEAVLSQMKGMQAKLKESAASRKEKLSSLYQAMRELLVQDERGALSLLEREAETGGAKIKSLSIKFQDNIGCMNRAKGDIQGLLARSQELDFLQTSYDVPQAAGFDPYAPRINLDSKRVLLAQTFAPALKDHLTELLRRPLEARLPIAKPELQLKETKVARNQSASSQTASAPKKKPKQSRTMEASGEPEGGGRPPSATDSLPEAGGGEGPPGGRPAAEAREKPDKMADPVVFGSGEKRSELLKWGTVLTFDVRTAHKRIVLSEGFTKACVSDRHADYPDCPQRFAVCSQVLATKGFSQGRHYWEVRMSCNNYVGVGLAYGSVERKGPGGRLGRNGQSWCVEWFNVRLSAWHDSGETVLVNPGPRRVGVLLDLEEGVATFYNVTDRAYPFHAFVFPFAEAVHPAFWIFSSGSSLSLCKLQA